MDGSQRWFQSLAQQRVSLGYHWWLFKVSNSRDNHICCSQSCHSCDWQSVCRVWRTTHAEEWQWLAVSERRLCKVCQLPWFQTQTNYTVLAKSQRRMLTLYENPGQMHQSCYRRRSFIQAKSACFLAELSCDATSNYWHQPCHCDFRQSYSHTTTRTERDRTRWVHETKRRFHERENAEVRRQQTRWSSIISRCRWQGVDSQP